MHASLFYNLKNLYSEKSYLTKILLLSSDIFLTIFSFCTALLITDNFSFSRSFFVFSSALGIMLLLRLLTFLYFKTYLLIVRYIGERDYRSVFFAVSSASFFFWFLSESAPNLLPAAKARAIIIIDYLFMLSMMIGLRMFLRFIFDRLRLQSGSRLNTVIFGAGELGTIINRVLSHNVSHDYRVVAYFDDKPQVHKKYLNGVKIFNPRKSFEQVVRKHDVKVAIIGIKNLPEERRIEFINQCLAHQIKVLKVPTAESWLNNGLNLGQLQKINFEDLLNRPPIQLDKKSISDSICGKVILVTGCAGSIGSEMVRQLIQYKPKLIIGVDQAETPSAELGLELKDKVKDKTFYPVIGDVRNHGKMRQIFEEYRPEYVFHAAAYKHVPIMEIFPEEAIWVNVMGTQIIADLSSEFQVKKFVMISTDKVVNPSNIMGASKRIAEMYIQSLNFFENNKTQFITTRFGNVLGSNGSVIPIFQKQIRNRLPLTVTHPDVTRFFMTIPEACQLVLEAGAMGNGGEIFVFDMGEPVRIYDLAKKMIQMHGLTLDKDIQIVFSGLRPGEKLTEELLDKQEGLIPTHHPKIRKAAVRPNDHHRVQLQVSTLLSKAELGENTKQLVKCMKEMVPEFISQNSPFTNLDSTSEKASLETATEK